MHGDQRKNIHLSDHQRICAHFSASEVQGEKEKLREELEHERRRKHQAEAVAAAAVGYGLYERHEKHEAEEELEKYEPEKEEKKHHGLFGRHWKVWDSRLSISNNSLISNDIEDWQHQFNNLWRGRDCGHLVVFVDLTNI